MTFSEDDYLQLSGLQHFAFCRRQWALIHIEQQWAENFRTVDGDLFHEKAHNGGAYESRGDIIITRGMAIHSPSLGLSGQCDVLEFHRGSSGIPIKNREGHWQPFPVEYKRGKAKAEDIDRLQLCAQAMCLEEMLCCEISEGALFYGETRRREAVAFTPELRKQVSDFATEMHELYRRGYTPKVRPKRSCNACSLKELCLPKLSKVPSVAKYLRTQMEETL